jgi:hypothetical protein
MIIPESAMRLAKRSGRMAQINHRLRWARQRVCPPQVGVVGGYHLGNLGDMALGYAVQRRVIESGLSCGLQTIYNLERWPKAKVAIVGGGAVGYDDNLHRLKERYGRFPDRVAILGVDFNDPAAVLVHAEFLNQVAVITCRSSKQAAELNAILGRKDVGWHPDLCFSIYNHNAKAETEKGEPSQVLGMNCTPLFMKQSGGQFVPGSSFLAEMQREEPQLLPYMERLGALYSNLVRAVCSKANQDGIRIKHIPFAPLDDVFARTILKDFAVEFMPYTSNLASVLSQVGLCGRFFTTRFHSLVFSILKHCEITPFCYASKCDRLLADLQIEHTSIIRIQELLDGKNGLVERVLEGPGIKVPTEVVAAVCRKVTANVDSAIGQLRKHMVD